MRSVRLLFLLIPFALLTSRSIIAQNQPLCGVTCEPDSASGTYAPTYSVRPLTKNARSAASPLSAPAYRKGRELSNVLLGSSSYSYAVPILSLPGRNGLDVNLTLFYNSAVWAINTGAGTATLNADRDFPSYGFRLGYGLIEAPPSGSTSYTLSEPDGGQRELRLSSGSVYTSVDSSYIDWNSSTRILRRRDGTQWTYQQVPGATTFFRPIKITDTNGNFISIAYSSATGADKQAIAAITDTLSRIVTFNYDANNRITSIVVAVPGGASRAVAYFSWGTKSLQYNFAAPFVAKDTSAVGTTINVLTSCSYSNAAGTGQGMGYSFSYGDWAIVNQVTRLSAGGSSRSYVRYDYPSAATALSDAPTYQHQFVSSDGTSGSEVAWAYQVTKINKVVSAVKVTDPTGTATTSNLFTSGWQTGLTSSVSVSSGSTTYRTSNLTWTQENTSLSIPLNPRITAQSTTLNDSGQTATVYTGYDSNGNITDVNETNYSGVLVRKTHTDYLATANYLNLHILNRPADVKISDGAGNLVTRTDFGYDSYGTGLTTVTGAGQHDDANFGSSQTTRGNLTQTTRYKTPTGPSGGIVRNLTYDTLGNLLTAQVDCCQQKVWTFTTNTKFSYPETVTSGGTVQLSTSASYDPLTGAILSQTDANAQITTLVYDSLNRLTSVTGPLSSSVSFVYDDVGVQPAATQTTATDSGKSTVQITTSDGLGRVVKQQTQDAGGQNVSIVETQFDSVDRVAQVSNPHTSAQSPVWTVYNYDVLGRVVKVIPTDGSASSNNTQFSYLGNSSIVTDQAGKQRRTIADPQGRIIEVDEPGWGSATPGTGSVTINGAIQRKCIAPGPGGTCNEYLYDTGTVRVTVNGFTASTPYGGIPRNPATTTAVASALATGLNGASSPVTASVSGSTINMTSRQSGKSTNYTLSSTSTSNDPPDFPVPSFTGQPSGATLIGGTDAATPDAPSLDHPMPTMYAYDVLDDLTLVVQGQQQRQFVYDALGRLSSATTPEGGQVSYTLSDYGLVLTRTDARNVQTSYQYDALNRLIGKSYLLNGTAWNAMPSVCTPSGGAPANVCYAYGTNAAAFNKGRLIQITDPAGSETHAYDALGRVVNLTKTVGTTAYPVGYAYDRVGNLKSITYPSGRVVQYTLDGLERHTQISSSGTNYISGLTYNALWQPTAFNFGNGVAASFGYNSRAQLSSLAFTKSGAAILSLSYDYVTGALGNNGQIQKITDNVDGTRSTTFQYDAWFRLKQTTNTQWTVTEGYDRYGNRNSQSAPVLFSQTADPTTNRLPSPYGYDLAGNMTNDGLSTLAYDGENRVLSSTNGSSSGSYTYDGTGLRVKKVSGSTTTVYIFSGAKVISEYDNGAAVASPSREYVYSGSQLVATLSGGATTYHQADQLSVRVSTDSNGNVVRTFGSYPFGETWYETGTASKLKFTSYERDSESGNDYATARSYISRSARFSSPDRFNASILDPQSMNRYAYVTNNPISLTDPLGLWIYNCGVPGNAPCAPLDGQGPTGGGGGGGAPKKPELPPPFDSGGGRAGKMDPTNFIGRAIVALLNPDCAELFGGFQRAMMALLKTDYNYYVPGQANPNPGLIRPDVWSGVDSHFLPGADGTNATAVTLHYRNRPGGFAFFSMSFKLDDPGFDNSNGNGQMTTFMHELEHSASIQGLDKSIDSDYKLDARKVNERCNPQIEQESSPISGELTPP